MEAHKGISLRILLSRSCTYISFALANFRTAHSGFTDIIFHILLAVCFFHSRFFFTPTCWKHLMLSYFGNSLTTVLLSSISCLRDGTSVNLSHPSLSLSLSHTHTHTHTSWDFSIKSFASNQILLSRLSSPLTYVKLHVC
jgi:hypothetical protein